MQDLILLGVYRNLDNRTKGLPDDSPYALELHNRRKTALHDVLDRQKNFKVLDWGNTDDTGPHEWVEISIGAIASAGFTYAIVPGLKFVAEKLVEKAIDEGTSEFMKWLISKLRPKQESKEILDFQIKLPDGTNISVDPPDRFATINITFADGSVSSITYADQPPSD